jgi:hypothetical protein
MEFLLLRSSFHVFKFLATYMLIYFCCCFLENLKTYRNAFDMLSSFDQEMLRVFWNETAPSLDTCFGAEGAQI